MCGLVSRVTLRATYKPPAKVEGRNEVNDGKVMSHENHVSTAVGFCNPEEKSGSHDASRFLNKMLGPEFFQDFFADAVAARLPPQGISENPDRAAGGPDVLDFIGIDPVVDGAARHAHHFAGFHDTYCLPFHAVLLESVFDQSCAFLPEKSTEEKRRSKASLNR